MPMNVADARDARERKSLPERCEAPPLKAESRPHATDGNLRVLAAEARDRTMKLDAAAETVGISPSRLSHKFADGSITLKELEALGPDYANELAGVMHERRRSHDPNARKRQLINIARRALDELSELP